MKGGANDCRSGNRILIVGGRDKLTIPAPRNKILTSLKPLVKERLKKLTLCHSEGVRQRWTTEAPTLLQVPGKVGKSDAQQKRFFSLPGRIRMTVIGIFKLS